nr:MAG TPA: hypothetical protein [Caudoviricetes sp.]
MYEEIIKKHFRNAPPGYYAVWRYLKIKIRRIESWNY